LLREKMKLDGPTLHGYRLREVLPEVFHRDRDRGIAITGNHDWRRAEPLVHIGAAVHSIPAKSASDGALAVEVIRAAPVVPTARILMEQEWRHDLVERRIELG
jgi:hypothetical protein